MSGKKDNKLTSFFEISQDQPQSLPPLQKYPRKLSKIPLTAHSGYFFIDFVEQGQLRVLKKLDLRAQDLPPPLQIEKYGRNMILNVEDSSKGEDQLAKYQQQRNALTQKRRVIDDKIKESLQKSKNRLKAKSLLAIRQQLIDEYTKPIDSPRLIRNEKKQSMRNGLILPGLNTKNHEIQFALKRLGLSKE